MSLSFLRKVWGLLNAREHRHALILFGLMWVSMLLEAIGIGVVVPATALMTRPGLAAEYPALAPILAWINAPDHATLVLYGMAALVGVYLTKTLFLGTLAWWETRFAFQLQARFSRDLLGRYLRQPYAFHLKHNSAELVRNVTGEVMLLTFDTVLPMIQLASELIVMAGIFTLILFVEPVGATAVGVLMAFVAFAFHRLTRQRARAWGEARMLHEGLRLQHVQQALGGIKDVRLLGREERFLALFAEHTEGFARVGQLQKTFLQFPRLGTEFLAVLGMGLLVAAMLRMGRPVADVVPVLGLFAAAAFRLIPSANRILGALQVLRFGAPVVDRLHGELSRLTVIPPLASTERVAFNHELRGEGLSLSYEGRPRPALDGIDVRVSRGEAIGFIGESGSGKSSLVDVLLGLIAPDAGRVTVDGQDVVGRERGWQDNVGYVPQNIYLTDDTIRANVAFGLPTGEINEERVWRALQMAQLDEVVRELPSGLDTWVGERGVRLSGGQRQRIGIARALYDDPQVLVLDEATSALDSETEASVMDAVFALKGSKTVLLVAHRLSTVARCDRLYELEAGKIKRELTPAQL